MANLTNSSFVLQKQKEEERVPVTKEDVDYVKGVFEDGKRQMKKGKWDLAVESFSKAIKKYRKNPVFYLKRAKCYLRLKKAKEAEADCTKALSLDPKLLKAKFQRSQARELMGNYRGACLDLQDIIILDPSNQTAKGELERLKPTYEDKLRQDGYNIFNDEEKEETEEEENKSVILGTLTGNDRATDEPDLGEIIHKANQEKEKGNKFVKEGKWEEAKEAYSKAINLNPEDAIFYANRALCHLKTKNEHRAVLDCSMALKKNPRYVKAYMRRAAARKETGDLWGARSDVKQTILLEPNNTQAKGLLEELNILIEQKVYQDFQYLEGESSKSEEEMEISDEPYYQQESGFSKINAEQEAIAVTNESSATMETTKSHAEFKYVLPVNKLPQERSKKPLRRVPIKFTDHEVQNQISQLKNNEENLPEWIKNPSSTKSTRINLQGQMKRTSFDINNQPEEKARLSGAASRNACSDKTLNANISDKKDFKYILPVNKKPHQRSKKPLARIPIKFTM